MGFARLIAITTRHYVTAGPCRPTATSIQGVFSHLLTLPSFVHGHLGIKHSWPLVQSEPHPPNGAAGALSAATDVVAAPKIPNSERTNIANIRLLDIRLTSVRPIHRAEMLQYFLNVLVS